MIKQKKKLKNKIIKSLVLKMAIENEQQLRSQSNEQTFLFPLVTSREYNVRESRMCSQSQT